MIFPFSKKTKKLAKLCSLGGLLLTSTALLTSGTVLASNQVSTSLNASVVSKTITKEAYTKQIQTKTLTDEYWEPYNEHTQEISIEQLAKSDVSVNNYNLFSKWASFNEYSGNVAYQDTDLKDLTTLDWSIITNATNLQLKNFITFFGRNHGLDNVKKIVFSNNNFMVSDPLFWNSIAHYLPHVIDFTINHNTTKKQTLPNEVGKNRFSKLIIADFDFSDKVGDIFYDKAPLSDSIVSLTFTNNDVITTDKFSLFDIWFGNNSGAELTLLQVLNLSHNKLTTVDSSLMTLPSVLSLDLSYNNLSTWHNINYNQFTKQITPSDSGLGQICFPNWNNIQKINVSHNQLYEIIHLSHQEWSNDIKHQYQLSASNTYVNLNQLDISNQKVDFECFVFGNDTKNNTTSMDIDLSNIYYLPSSLKDNPEELNNYLIDCLVDVKDNINDDVITRYDNLQKTKNLMPSIVDIFNFTNLTSNPVNQYTNFSKTASGEINQLPDVSYQAKDASFAIWGVNAYASDGHRQVNYYMHDNNNPYQNDENHTYLTSDTSYITKNAWDGQSLASDSKLGSKLTKGYYDDNQGWPSATGLSSNFTNNLATYTISPHFLHPITGDIDNSTYNYNVYIFNHWPNIFFLKGIDKNNPTLANIQDEVNIDKEYMLNNFEKLFTYYGNENLWGQFLTNYKTSEDYFKIIGITNDTINREIHVFCQFPLYDFTNNISQSTVVPPAQTQLIIFHTEPYVDRLSPVLSKLLIAECALLLLLIIPYTVIKVKNINRTKAIKQLKQNTLVLAKTKPEKPKSMIKDVNTTKKKRNLKTNIKDFIKDGKSGWKEYDTITQKGKVDKQIKDSLGIDDILKDIES